MIEIRPAESTDPAKLAPHMREADAAEVRAASGSTPLEALERALGVSSSCFTAWIGGTPLAMFGVREIASRIGIIWFLGSDLATKDAKQFMRLSRQWLKAFQEEFDVLGNVVDERNTVHVRWIRAMGFTFSRFHMEHGHEKRPFMEFDWRAKEVASV